LERPLELVAADHEDKIVRNADLAAHLKAGALMVLQSASHGGRREKPLIQLEFSPAGCMRGLQRRVAPDMPPCMLAPACLSKLKKQTPRRRHLKMKLVRYGAPGREKPGIIGDDGKIRDLSRIVKDIDGAMLGSGGLAKIKKANLKRMKPVSGKPRLGPCIGNVKNFIAIGLNYSDHAAEAGMPIPKEPIIFNKVTTCICGPNDDTITPRESGKLDYEVELGIVIGKRARYLAKDKAKDAIAGYFLSNDVSERVFQIERSGGQWDKGKGCETFGPLGPWFVTKDEIKDPQDLDMWLDVNGERRQRGNTRTMIFGCEHLVWYCSQFFVMEPGDIIITGTPPGVALGMKPAPVFLKAGDVVTLGISKLGEQRQKIVAAK
jgi:2-keto-4-pentenoate hydratase/2-oxohepta-3-ene-1,7-dioic acid hydratase in catechol pathway